MSEYLKTIKIMYPNENRVESDIAKGDEDLLTQIDALQKWNLELQRKLDIDNLIEIESKYKIFKKISLSLVNTLLNSYESNAKLFKEILFDLKDLKINFDADGSNLADNKNLKYISNINKMIIDLGIKVRDESNKQKSTIKALKEDISEIENDDIGEEILEVINKRNKEMEE